MYLNGEEFFVFPRCWLLEQIFVCSLLQPVFWRWTNVIFYCNTQYMLITHCKINIQPYKINFYNETAKNSLMYTMYTSVAYALILLSVTTSAQNEFDKLYFHIENSVIYFHYYSRQFCVNMDHSVRYLSFWDIFHFVFPLIGIFPIKKLTKSHHWFYLDM